MLWQKRARLFVLAIAVGVVAVVFLTTRRREEPPPPKPLERGDPAATIESSGAFVVQVKGESRNGPRRGREAVCLPGWQHAARQRQR
jgi:hypothetical protein